MDRLDLKVTSELAANPVAPAAVCWVNVGDEMSAVRFVTMFGACRQLRRARLPAGFFAGAGLACHPVGKSDEARLIRCAAAMSAGDDRGVDAESVHPAMAAAAATLRAVPSTPRVNRPPRPSTVTVRIL
jgi:hypothetical protein